MSLVFSAITSHSPLLIPEIGKENFEKLEQTKISYDKLTLALVEAKPDVIIIFSPHGVIQPKSFTLNMAEKFTGQFNEFSDFTNKFDIAGDLELASRIKEALESKTDLQVINEPELDYGSAVPLFLLTKELPEVRVIPIYHSQGDLRQHYDFGKLLTKPLHNSEKKIAIIASADLSHCLSAKSPGGYSPKAKRFDKKVVKAVIDNKVEDLLAIEDDLLKEVSETGLRSIAILLGVMSEQKKTAKLLSYEAPFGVGCLMVDYDF